MSDFDRDQVPPTVGSPVTIELVRGAPEQHPHPRLPRWAVVGVAVLVAVTALAAVIIGATMPPPRQAPTERGWLGWVATLVDAPPRGEVATESFSRDLAAQIEELSRTTQSRAFEGPGGQDLGEQEARVLFADDVADRRIALVALHTVSIVVAQRYASTRLLWLAGPRNASPEALADVVTEPTAGNGYQVKPVNPFTNAEFVGRDGPVRVAVAPPDCTVMAAPGEDLTSFQPEPTGSYLVRTPTTYLPEFWRVTCDGVVREERPAPRPAVTSEAVDEVLAGAAGSPDRLTVENELRQLYRTFGFELLHAPEVLWAGTLRHVPAHAEEPVVNVLDGPSPTVLASPAARGGWIGMVWMSVEAQPDRVTGLTPYFVTNTDLAAADAVLGVPLGLNRLVLVLAPASAATVRLVDREGTVLAGAAVTERAFLLSLPEDGPPLGGVQVQAVDAADGVFATADLAVTSVEPYHQTNWR